MSVVFDGMNAPENCRSCPVKESHVTVFSDSVKCRVCGQWNETPDKLPTWCPAQTELVRCRDCEFWTKQKKSLQGRCELNGSYPTGAWFCGNAKKRTDNAKD